MMSPEPVAKLCETGGCEIQRSGELFAVFGAWGGAMRLLDLDTLTLGEFIDIPVAGGARNIAPARNGSFVTLSDFRNHPDEFLKIHVYDPLQPGSVTSSNLVTIGESTLLDWAVTLEDSVLSWTGNEFLLALMVTDFSTRYVLVMRLSESLFVLGEPQLVDVGVGRFRVGGLAKFDDGKFAIALETKVEGEFRPYVELLRFYEDGTLMGCRTRVHPKRIDYGLGEDRYSRGHSELYSVDGGVLLTFCTSSVDSLGPTGTTNAALLKFKLNGEFAGPDEE